MDYCTTCGKQVTDDWRYCPSCGTRRALPAPASLEEYRRRLVAELDRPQYTPPSRPTELQQVMGEVEGAVDSLWGRAWTSRMVPVPGTRHTVLLPIAAMVVLLAFVVLTVVTDGATLVLLLVLLAAAIFFAVSGRTSRSAAFSDAPGDLRQRVAEKLDACHSLIAEIEGTIGINLLPSDSPLLKGYVAALEARAEGWGRFEEASTRVDLAEADRWATHALDGLRRTRDALADSSQNHG